VAIILIFALTDPSSPLRLFDRLTAYFILVEWLALVFAIAAVFILRRTMPAAPRPYRVPGYPFVPAVFLVGTIVGLGAILWSAISRGDYSPLFGLGIMAAGFPVYGLWRRKVGPAVPLTTTSAPPSD
jgi:APA family basic amino acid/polyamine antiporter